MSSVQGKPICGREAVQDARAKGHALLEAQAQSEGKLLLHAGGHGLGNDHDEHVAHHTLGQERNA
jgi:hypothetical protein